MSGKSKGLFVEIVSGLLVFLFVYASVSKLFDFDEFKLELSKSPFITQFSSILVWALPAIEIIVSVLLVFPVARIFGLYASLFLLTLFTAYLIAMLNFSYYIPCSCGGIISKLSWNGHIVLNACFIVVNIGAILLQIPSQKFNIHNCMQKGKPKT